MSQGSIGSCNKSAIHTGSNSPDSDNPDSDNADFTSLGTYKSDDITFLLSALSAQEIEGYYTDTSDKETRIQQGVAHYSEMLSRESAPDERYLHIFEQALARFGKRMGEDIARLAIELSQRISGPVTLLSLVRAGVPIGVLLHRALKASGCSSSHYGISIIRDRGIDTNALKYVLARHDPNNMVFVDGWTGKGAISDELETSMRTHRQLGIKPRLVTLADPAGRAWLSASNEDWLIPSGILGSTVSGLVSRSVLRKNWQTSSEFHACAQLDYLATHDLSQRFVDTIHKHVLEALANHDVSSSLKSGNDKQNSTLDAQQLNIAQQASAVIDRLAEEFSIENINRIKPGIAEATRAVLRRVPERIIVSSRHEPDLAALVHLAQQAGVSIDERADAIAPYRAVTIIAHRGIKESDGQVEHQT